MLLTPLSTQPLTFSHFPFIFIYHPSIRKISYYKTTFSLPSTINQISSFLSFFTFKETPCWVLFVYFLIICHHNHPLIITHDYQHPSCSSTSQNTCLACLFTSYYGTLTFCNMRYKEPKPISIQSTLL